MDEDMDISLGKIVEVIGPVEVIEFWKKTARREGEDIGDYLKRTSSTQQPGEPDADYAERTRLADIRSHIILEKSEMLVRGDTEEITDYHKRIAGFCTAIGVGSSRAAVLVNVAVNSYETDESDFPSGGQESAEKILAKNSPKDVELTTVVNEVCQEAFATVFSRGGLSPQGEIYSGERGMAVRFAGFLPRSLESLDIVQNPDKYGSCKLEMVDSSTAVLYVLGE